MIAILTAAALMATGPADFPRPMPGPGWVWVAPGVVAATPPQGPVIDWVQDARETLGEVRVVARDVRSLAGWCLSLLADLTKWFLENYPSIRAGAVKAGATLDGLGWGTLAKLGGAFLLLSLLSAALQAGAVKLASKKG